MAAFGPVAAKRSLFLVPGGDAFAVKTLHGADGLADDVPVTLAETVAHRDDAMDRAVPPAPVTSAEVATHRGRRQPRQATR